MNRCKGNVGLLVGVLGVVGGWGAGWIRQYLNPLEKLNLNISIWFYKADVDYIICSFASIISP